MEHGMDHLTEQDLADWQRHPGDRKAEIEDHLSRCAPCRALADSHLKLLSLLDRTPCPDIPDQTDRVIALMTREKYRRFWDWPVLMKAAAGVILSTGVGYYAGIFSRPANAPLKPDPQLAAEMLHLDELGASATGELRNLFLTQETISDQERSG